MLGAEGRQVHAVQLIIMVFLGGWHDASRWGYKGGGHHRPHAVSTSSDGTAVLSTHRVSHCYIKPSTYAPVNHYTESKWPHRQRSFSEDPSLTKSATVQCEPSASGAFSVSAARAPKFSNSFARPRVAHMFSAGTGNHQLPKDQN